MDDVTFYGLRPGAAPSEWRFDVVRNLCSGIGALFGGAGLGASITALEHHTGRPTVWATAQFLEFATPPAEVVIEVDEVVRGHQVSQARAVGRVDGREIFTVNAALGERDVPYAGEWAERPTHLPHWSECRDRDIPEHMRGTISDRIDMRLADAKDWDDFDGTPGSGRAALWVRLPELLEVSAAALAIVGDYVPFGISQALGHRAGGNSLDNTLRVTSRTPSEWILADIRIHAVGHGFGHGLVHLWSEHGVLLGSASQSAIVREIRDEPRVVTGGRLQRPAPKEDRA